jgi:hypothetical protein
MDAEARVRELGLDLPDYSATQYYGPSYGSMKSHHQVGSLLFLSGHVPELAGGGALHPGRLGAEVTIPQGYEAARLTGINALAGIRYAIGSLDRVRSIVRSLCFVVCLPEFHDVHKRPSSSRRVIADRSYGWRCCGAAYLSREPVLNPPHSEPHEVRCIE